MARFTLKAARKATTMPLSRVYPSRAGKEPVAPPIRTANAEESPKYIRIRDWLLDRILASNLTQGDRLPSEHDLIRQFDVSRVTVRQALEALRADGIVESHHGKGWFLRRVCAVQNLGRLLGFGEMLAPMGVRARSEVLDSRECPAPAAVTTAFGEPPDSIMVRIARLRIASGRVMSYDVSYFPLEVGRRLIQQDLAGQDIFVLLERALKMPLGFADVTIEIAPAEADQAARLNVAPATPIFKMTRLTHDSCGFPIDFEYVYGLPESHVFKVRVPRR
jgi:GntR family transcriptional regulator